MNAVISVGPPGPAPPATATSPPAETGPEEATPFAQALEGADQRGSPPPEDAGEVSAEPEPASSNAEALLQLLLGLASPTGDQTATGIADQPGRAAGAGADKGKHAGTPANEELLVGLIAQLAVPSAETDAEQQTVALPALAVAKGLQAGGPAADAAAATTATELGSGQTTEVTVEPAAAKAPRVVLPDAAADAPRSENAPVAIPDGEQQHALPLAQTDGTISAAPTKPADAPADIEALEAAVALETEATQPSIEATGEAGAAIEGAELSAVDVDTDASSGKKPSHQASADATTPPVQQPAPTPLRSTAPTVSTDAAPADPLTAEVFTAELAGTVRRASLLGDQEVRLLLNPPELGHLDVRIVDSQEGLRVVLAATTREAHELIEQQLPSLRHALEARALKVERLQVDQAPQAASADGQSHQGLRQDSHGQGNGQHTGQFDQGGVPWSSVASIRASASDELVASGGAVTAAAATRPATGDGRLDVLA